MRHTPSVILGLLAAVVANAGEPEATFLSISERMGNLPPEFEIDCAVGPNSRDSSCGVRPARTRSTNWWDNPV